MLNEITLSQCHTLRGCVDWNTSSYHSSYASWCHTLRGCVDWNQKELSRCLQHHVTPFVGVWIETAGYAQFTTKCNVTPFVGVWIETCRTNTGSLPTNVTPFVGVWIETVKSLVHFLTTFVTPFVGVWIETYLYKFSRLFTLSHPSWVCGLKHICNHWW